MNVREERHFPLFGAAEGSLALGQLSCSCKGGRGEVLVGNGYRTVHIGQIEVAPVDSYLVASLSQNLLILAAALDELTAAFSYDGRYGCLTVVVDRQFRGCSKEELHIVLLSVVRFHLIRDEVDRC